MKTYVIDASVILTSLKTSENSVFKRLSKILIALKNKKAEIIAPSLLLYELANGIRFSYEKKAHGVEVLVKSVNVSIKTVELKPHQIEVILALSYDLKTTVYDTSYHFLAKLYNGTFLTCDENYYKKAKKIGQIELLK